MSIIPKIKGSLFHADRDRSRRYIFMEKAFLFFFFSPGLSARIRPSPPTVPSFLMASVIGLLIAPFCATQLLANYICVNVTGSERSRL